MTAADRPVVLVATDGGTAALVAARADRSLFAASEPVLVSVVPVFDDPELDMGGIEGPAGDPETDAAVIVVGWSHHGAIAGTLTGSAAEHLVHHGRRPVLVVPEPPTAD